MISSPLEYIGALCFGLVVGYVTYRVLVRTTDRSAITDLTAVLGAVGGGAVTGLFDPQTELFAMYAIGLAVGMAVYGAIYYVLNGKEATAKVLAGREVTTPPPPPVPSSERPL
jgi:uncharacterized membrane protein YeaQ/YmgE (transglycosylase-associated protein family)